MRMRSYSTNGISLMSQLKSWRVSVPLQLYAIKVLYLCTFRSARSQGKSPSDELEPKSVGKE